MTAGGWAGTEQEEGLPERYRRWQEEEVVYIIPPLVDTLKEKR
jgi:hypothetical protein